MLQIHRIVQAVNRFRARYRNGMLWSLHQSTSMTWRKKKWITEEAMSLLSDLAQCRREAARKRKQRREILESISLSDQLAAAATAQPAACLERKEEWGWGDRYRRTEARGGRRRVAVTNHRSPFLHASFPAGLSQKLVRPPAKAGASTELQTLFANKLDSVIS